MCDPVTAMMAASAGMSAGGKLFEGIAGGAASDFSADIAKGNAALLHTQERIAQGDVDIATIRGNYDEFLTRRKVGKVLAGQSAYYASNNVDPSYGSPLALQGFTAAQGETDAQLIRARMMGERADAMTRVANIAGAAAGQTAKWAAEKNAGDVKRIAGVIGAGTSFLSAATKWPGLGGSGGGSSGTAFRGDFASDPFWLQQPENI